MTGEDPPAGGVFDHNDRVTVGTMEQHPNFVRTQQGWDAVAAGDYMTAIDDYAENIVVDNGPGAGPFRHVEGRDAYIAAAFEFIPLFGDTWSQHGSCIYADDTCSVSLVHETGTAVAGHRFDNRALWINRYGPDGKSTDYGQSTSTPKPSKPSGSDCHIDLPVRSDARRCRLSYHWLMLPGPASGRVRA